MESHKIPWFQYVPVTTRVLWKGFIDHQEPQQRRVMTTAGTNLPGWFLTPLQKRSERSREPRVNPVEQCRNGPNRNRWFTYSKS